MEETHGDRGIAGAAKWIPEGGMRRIKIALPGIIHHMNPCRLFDRRFSRTCISVLFLAILCGLPSLLMPACSASKPGPWESTQPMTETELLATHPLLVKRHELYERTGLFIGILNDTIVRLLMEPELTHSQKNTLLKIRIEAARGIVSAASQPDVIYSQLEVLFFSRLFLEVTTREANKYLPPATAARLIEAINEMEKLFWTSSNQDLEVWRKRVDENVKEFLAEYPELQSIGYVNSSLYTIGNRKQRNRIYTLFGINSQLANTTQSIYQLNEAAEQFIFLSQIIPQISIWEFEYTMQRLIKSMDAGVLNEVADLPRQLDVNIRDLTRSLETQREELSKSLLSATSQIQAAVSDLDGNLDGSIKALNLGLSKHVDGIISNTSEIGAGLDRLTSQIETLSEAINELPHNIVETLNNLPEDVKESATHLRWSVYMDIALLLTAIVLSSTLSAFIISRLTRK